MQQYSLTYLDLQNEATHAIGGAPDPNAPLTRVINGALEYLYNSHGWSWRTAISTLDFTAGIGQIALPSDFGELVDLVGFQAKYTAVKPANWRDILRVRVHGVPDQQICIYHVGAGGQYQVANPTSLPTLAMGSGAGLPNGTYYVRFTWTGNGGGETAGGPENALTLTGSNGVLQVTVPAAPTGAGNANVYVGVNINKEQLAGSVAGGGTLNVTALPLTSAAYFPVANTTFDATQVMQKVLEVAPLPATQLFQALYLTYRRTPPKLVNNTDVPAVPYNFFDLLRTLVRAFAVSSTVQQAGHDWQVFNDQLPLYKAADGMAQGSPGKLIDATMEDDGLYATQPWTSIKSPYDP